MSGQMTSAVKRREQPVAEPKATGKAGRNLPAAIGVGVGLGAVIIASLLVVKVAFLGVVALAVVVALHELSVALKERGVSVPLIPVTAGGLGILASAYFAGEGAQTAVLGLTVVAVLVWRLADGAEGYLRDATAGLFAVVYVPFLAAFAMLLTAQDKGAEKVLLFLLLVVCNDTGGYAAGVLFGRHPMAPRISPKKSWEGLAGSVVTAAVAGALWMDFVLHGKPWQGAVLGVAVVASATLGDLCESMIKRDLGIKDMGRLLPGHGGIMDRLDSLLPTAPVVYLLLQLFLKH
ncbi:phosphatidate cytidylyltransferase [Actinospica robiniae]|uniref:phosphatidate cytidylyltransferase n=1 Tax=Actinospica robiniae TaxID=304901 RepID=UPI0004117E33|nr:phosphatidate cytidylyltransferase [Actinospica robiniae]